MLTPLLFCHNKVVSSFSLVAASRADGKDILNMLNEIGVGEQGFSSAAYNLKGESFKAYLMTCEHHAQGMNLEEGRVPQTTYWFKRQGYPLGLIKLRHCLNESLRQQGGHVGYSIRPSERGKGYGTHMLSAVLVPARALGLSSLLLTVYENNLPSRKMIERNSGVLETITNGICYYWISLENQA